MTGYYNPSHLNKVMLKSSSLLHGTGSRPDPLAKEHGRNTVSPPADSCSDKDDLWIFPDIAAKPLLWMCFVFCHLWSSQDDGTQQDRNIAGYPSNIMDK